MSTQSILILDFDSTIISVESLDLLAEISLAKHPEKKERLKQIEELTKLGMEGKLSIKETLTQRIKLLDAKKSDLTKLVALLKKSLTPSFAKHKAHLKKASHRLYIVTSGFEEFVMPVAEMLGIPKSHVFANTFIYDKQGNITGFDASNSLSAPGGKVKVVKSLKLKGSVFAVGDGITDLEIKEGGAAEKFFCFAEIVERAPVAARADAVVYGIDEVLFETKLPSRYSYPRSRMKILLLESVDKEAVNRLKNEGYRVESFSRAFSEEELISAISDCSFLGIRSKTQVTGKVLRAGKKLLGVGAFCIGTDQIDLKAASSEGIAVFNAPFSNTRSVVELTLGEIILLMRKASEQSMNLHKGIWNKSATGAREIRGKKLGIVGYGNIGSQLSVLAEGLGMEVYYYDIAERLALGNARRCESLKQLLKISDVVTIHVDGRKENSNLIGKKEFELMKEGAVFLNLSRGHIVNINALKEALLSKRIAGAAVDVFPDEPKSNDEPFNSPLCGVPNTILTPHIGGSTAEAQRAIGGFVAERILRFIGNGDTEGSLTLPPISLSPLSKGTRFLHVHDNVPGILAQVNSILANHGVNILAQQLKTLDAIGYMVTDVADKLSDALLRDLRAIPHTIRLRAIYP